MRIDRQEALDRTFHDNGIWDIIVVGGGATGMGVAVDAASRGFRCALFEQHDFGKGTSSRSTKLIHGGVRYLKQGRIGLVREALHERGILQRNAPHLVHELPFVVPAYQWWELPFYGTGLALYGWLSGPMGFGRSVTLSGQEVVQRLPSLKTEGLRGGVLYHDGQFDDSRLLINLAQTAVQEGAAILNYVQVVRTIHDKAHGHAVGVLVRDIETGREAEVRARCVINATGAFCDNLRRADDPTASSLVAPSQGAHVVLDRSFLPGNTALMLPRTPDGRVLFAIPWHQHLLLGTTDTPINEPSLEPRPLADEVDFLLETAGRYLTKAPGRSDVLSTFAGIRPLVRNGAATRTASLSREHVIDVAPSGLITITGGKWTTYRTMAEQVIDRAIQVGGLSPHPCVTAQLKIQGADDASAVQQLIESNPALSQPLDAAMPITAAHVYRAVTHEGARTVEDVLARRTRALHLDARAAIRMAAAVARVLAAELNRDHGWQDSQLAQFNELASRYLID
jgi:glycerol-3-phosphate dehydrogenase